MSHAHTESSRPGRPIPRRRFIAGATATAAAATIVRPGRVRGSEANTKIEVGCVGLGSRGRLIADRMQAHGGYRITAVADYFPEVARAAAAKYGVPRDRVFSGLLGYRKLIAAKVDAVFLETPPYCFPDHAVEAVNAGCHVYLAKPVANDVPGCLTIIRMGEAAPRKKRVFLVDFQMRIDPHLIESVKRVHAGALGKIGLIRCFYDDNGFSDPPLTANWESRLQRLIWVNDIVLGGGKIVNCGIHALDAALWAARSLPVSCTGSSVINRPNAHGDALDCHSLTYRLANGTILNFTGQLYPIGRGFNCGFELYGRDGFLETRYAGKTRISGGKKPYAGGEVKDLYVRGINENLATFHKNVIEGNHDNSTVEPSVNSTLATILGREAGRHHTTLTWDEFIKANRKLELDFAGMTM